MRSKSLIAIVLIGFCGLAAMAAVTKIAFDQDKNLRNIATFTSHFREVFAARGVEAVKFRRFPKKGGAELTLTMGEADVGPEHPMHADMADLVIESFPKSRGTLTIEYYRQAGFGCQQSTAFLARELPFSEAKARRQERQRRDKIRDAIQEDYGLVEIESVERHRARVEVSLCLLEREPPKGADLKKALDSCAANIRRFYPLAKNGRLFVTLRCARGGERRDLARGDYDKAGRRLQLEIVPPPVSDAARDAGEPGGGAPTGASKAPR